MFDLEISFSSQPSSALRIQDGGHTFREEVLSVRMPKLRPHCRLHYQRDEVRLSIANRHYLLRLKMRRNHENNEINIKKETGEVPVPLASDDPDT